MSSFHQKGYVFDSQIRTANTFSMKLYETNRQLNKVKYIVWNIRALSFILRYLFKQSHILTPCLDFSLRLTTDNKRISLWLNVNKTET